MGGMGVARRSRPRSRSGSAAAWNPDTDPAFQKALRDRLISDDDSIFFNTHMMDTANKTVYGLQDPCTGGRGRRPAQLRPSRSARTIPAKTRVSMDIVVGGASDGARHLRGTQMCVSDAQAGGAGDDGYVPLPTFTLQDFQRLAVAPARTTCSPPRTPEEHEHNVYAVARPQTSRPPWVATPCGARLPAQYTWNYGDGAYPWARSPHRRSLPDGRGTLHGHLARVHLQPATARVALTTSFYGEYNIAGDGVASWRDQTK
ncbi:hypothetical protein QJS66_00470 [Kocuria rhizophila]|nr:hypothetical protein QJS66_00470 [Kocuria rhizophila]